MSLLGGVDEERRPGGVLLWTPGRVVVTVRWLVHRRDMSGGGGVGTRGDHAGSKGSGDRVAVDSGAEVCCKGGKGKWVAGHAQWVRRKDRSGS